MTLRPNNHALRGTLDLSPSFPTISATVVRRQEDDSLVYSILLHLTEIILRGVDAWGRP
jgi:hypothetical protein